MGTRVTSPAAESRLVCTLSLGLHDIQLPEDWISTHPAKQVVCLRQKGLEGKLFYFYQLKFFLFSQLCPTEARDRVGPSRRDP